MSNWYPSDPEMYEDVQTRWQYNNVGTKKSPEKRLQRLWHGSRDSARTPVQWDNSENAGFSTAAPWFFVNENYKEVNVARQENDKDSILNFYRNAIKWRKQLSCVRYGTYKEYYKNPSKIYVYEREDKEQKILVVCSYTDKCVKFKSPKGYDLSLANLILQNYREVEESCLQPYETRVYLIKK